MRITRIELKSYGLLIAQHTSIFDSLSGIQYEFNLYTNGRIAIMFGRGEILLSKEEK